MIRTAVTFVLTGLWSGGIASAVTTTLYNGSLGTSPQSQGYLSYYSLPGTGVETVGSTSTTYDATANINEHGGFSNDTILGTPVNAAFPILDAANGFSVSFTLQELAESHGADNDRAGVSLIVLDSVGTGVELGFWANQIFAQSATFTHAESGTFNTTNNSPFVLTISGTTYTLSVPGSGPLTGSLRDYSLRGTPYNLSNYLFIGDDTGSAQGAFSLANLSVTTPEPAMLGVLAMTGIGLCRRRSNRLA